MSKADLLGAGRFGSNHSVSARRAAIGAATGVPTTGVPDPTELPVDKISLNPDNPRSSLGDLADLAGSLRDHGQKQAITVMNRDAYIAANPQRAEQLEANTTHVVIDGSSRLAAARDSGLTTMKVMVDDGQGASEDELLESALVANIHRQDLDPLDEARALERLKAIHGTQEALAKRLHRSQGWVSQRLALLGLTPELQQRLAAGEESVDLLRAVGKKPKEQQETALGELKRRRAEKEKPKAPTRSAESKTTPGPSSESTKDAGGSVHYGVMNGTSRGEPPAGEARPAPETTTSPRINRTTGSSEVTEEAGERRQVKMPWHDGVACADIANSKMMREERDRMIERLLQQQSQERGETSESRTA